MSKSLNAQNNLREFFDNQGTKEYYDGLALEE